MATRSFFERPPLDQRYRHFLDNVVELRSTIRELQQIVDETGSERADRLLNRFIQLERRENEIEGLYREAEIREFWDNPGEYPHAVRTWFFFYRDKEMK